MLNTCSTVRITSGEQGGLELALENSNSSMLIELSHLMALYKLVFNF